MNNLSVEEKIQKIENELGPYEKWNEEESLKVASNEELACLFDIGVCNELLKRDNEFFTPILFDTSIGNRCQLGYFLAREISKEEDENKRNEVIKEIRNKNDPILNLFMDMLELENTDKLERQDEEIKSDILSLKKYLVCISTSVGIEDLLYSIITQFEQIYFDHFERNIVSEVVCDEYDSKISYINNRSAALFRELETENNEDR